MSPQSETPAAPAGFEKHFQEPIRLWEIAFLLAFAAAILWAGYWQSSKEYLNNDELLTSLLVTNPSFSQMWTTIQHGGELNPPLFFVLEWAITRVFGPGEWALRAISPISIALSAWVLFFILRPFTGPRLAALAVAFVLGLSREVFNFGHFARYYALLLLLVSLAVFLALRIARHRQPKWPDYALVLLLFCSLAYLHLYGLLYGGVILAAIILFDWLRGQPRWGLYVSILAGWLAFVFWIPSMRLQLKSAAGGVYTPSDMLDLGFFLEQLALQTPLALIFLFVALLGTLALISPKPNRMADEAAACSAPTGWFSLILVALALMCVPLGTWLASRVMYPPPYMVRYMFPTIVSWVLIVGLALLAAHRLPPATLLKFPALPTCGSVAWLSLIAFCLLFQPMRARKNPTRPAQPFIDEDFGHRDLPILFENSWYYLQRVRYGQGRQYAMLIDADAADADRGWYTKLMEHEFRHFAPHYNHATFLYPKDLPNWSDSFLAIDDDYTRTFEWFFAHHPEYKTELLGKFQSDPPIFGEQRVYFVHRN